MKDMRLIMEKFKIIALYGMSGAGKDTILNKIIEDYGEELNLNPIVSCTTRPPREGEVDGVAYHFLSNENFANKVVNSLFFWGSNSFNFCCILSNCVEF